MPRRLVYQAGGVGILPVACASGGSVAQGQSSRLIIDGSEVRILPLLPIRIYGLPIPASVFYRRFGSKLHPPLVIKEGNVDRAGDSSALLRGFELALRLEGLKPHTVQTYHRYAEMFVASLRSPLPVATQSDVRTFLDEFSVGRTAKTLRDAQLGLRRFFRFLVQEGEMKANPAQDIKLARYRTDPQPAYTEAEFKRLLLACGPRTQEGLRNKALLLTLYDTGVRVGELVSMGLPDWDAAQVRVTGKTGVRNVPLGLASLQAVERYTRKWGIVDAPLWRGNRGGMTASGVFQAVTRLCKRAGVAEKGVHAFRRAAAAQMKRLGMNDSDILEVMGWRDISMLRRYTATVAEELAQLAHRQHSPADSL